jgi:hypothetical protein
MADLLDPANGIFIYKGSSKLLSLDVVSKDGKPFPINGATLWFSVKRQITDPLPLFQKSSRDSAQIAITAPDVGKAEIYLLPSDTQSLDARTYVFDVWIELSTGERYLLVPPSDFRVERSVTTFLI